MDDPGLDPGVHAAALAGLERINWLSRSWQAIWNPIRGLARLEQQPLSVLDVACGSGDLLLNMSRQAARESIPMHWTGLDVSQTAVQLATERAERQGSQVEFVCANAADIATGQQYDVVCCSLFLHHLPAAECVELLTQMKATARRMVLVQDLRRTRTGYWLAQVIPRLVTRSQIVHVDGVRSVRAAFSIDEAHKLAEAAGLDQVVIRKIWPQRFLLQWNRESFHAPLEVDHVDR